MRLLLYLERYVDLMNNIFALTRPTTLAPSAPEKHGKHI